MAVTFKELRKAAKAFSAGPFKLAIAGDCATQFLTTCVKGALANKGIAGEIYEADYNQVARQMLNADSELHQFAPDVAILWETAEHWWSEGGTVDARLKMVSEYANAFPGKVLYVNAVSMRDGAYGSFVGKGNSFSAQVREFNAGLDGLSKKLPNLYVVDLNSLIADVGRSQSYDASTYMLADVPLVPDVQALLAKSIADILVALQGKTKKCVVVDLDNTLWGGVIGEDGMSGIKVGDHGVGKAFANFQRFLRRLKERGVLLAVCSKNDEAIAKEVFEQHPDMVLKLDDFACFAANWETKADNVAYIQKLLNIGIDSFVFIDDNPVEREIVRMAHPLVAVPEMPEDPSVWVDFLTHENLFETVSYSENDAERTKQYQVEAQRQAFAATFKDEASFLRNLEMSATSSRLDDFTIPRAAQLTQRSNQFNMRTIRYTEAELHAYANDPSVVELGFTLEDKFGSHGLVSVLIGKKISPQEMEIDTWLMSCRVLKRGLEYFALDRLVHEAEQMGVSSLLGEYIPTKKNGMVKDLYNELGFTKVSENHYLLEISNYKKKENYIHEK